MKKTVLIVLALVLILPCFAWAGGALDGVWWSPVVGESLGFMIYEDVTSVVPFVYVVALNIPTGSDIFRYCVLTGEDGVEINLNSNPDLCGFNISATVTLISETSATVKINQCSVCTLPSSFNIEKLY
jgi:hypothetical protein